MTEPSERSDSVTTLLVGEDHSPACIRDFCVEVCGVTLGLGISELAGRSFRIAHMGHVNAPMMLGTLGCVEVALRVTGIPHGEGGVQAAIDLLGDALG